MVVPLTGGGVCAGARPVPAAVNSNAMAKFPRFIIPPALHTRRAGAMMPGFSAPGYMGACLGKLVQQHRDMTGLAAGAMRDLVTAAGAICHDNGIGISAQRGQQ